MKPTFGRIRMNLSEWFHDKRHDPTTHIALGDIRLTIGDQEEALEIVVRLEARIKALEANTSKSVLRRIDAQLGVDDEN